MTDRKELEKLWRQRVADARTRWDFARTFVKEVQRDIASGAATNPDGNYALTRAMWQENLALTEYQRVLRVYTALVLNGEIPEDKAIDNPQPLALAMQPPQICPQKQRLSDALLEAANAITTLQEADTAQVISGGAGVPGIEIALEAARARWRDAKLAFFAHVKEHGC